MQHPILKIVTNKGCQSYLIGCPTTRAALLVDPKVGCEGIYREMLGHYGLELKAVLDTHTHADHLSAATQFMGAGVELWMSGVTQVKREYRGLVHGQEVQLGELRFEVLEVPGHTPDSVALFGHGMVLTGDSLFIDGLARADFVGSDPAQLFESVKTRLMSLPDDTLVMPGHGYNDILFSTIGCERERNAGLRFDDGGAYGQSLQVVAGAGNSDAVNANLLLNLQSHPSLPETPGNAAACCAAGGGGSAAAIPEIAAADAQAVHTELSGPEQWVDVRDPFEYAAGRIPDVTSIPLSELGFHLERLRGGDPLYISCRSGVRSMTAAKTLQRLGVALNPINVGGGILGWQDQGFPIEGQPAV
ncbi:MAG: glyoxylase-like metal-dependent hydrolase (beta-lactamase superfamily II) [Planctomycetota bacterium]|jgi:glyoxylase-like metal-dependent hydrolase (beta-lactamase superfamily II)/rhodanese-related sulfurtransferase